MPFVCTITDLNISNTHILCVTDSLSTSILTLIVLLAGFFNFFFTLAAFSVFVISLFSLIEDFHLGWRWEQPTVPISPLSSSQFG